jgi:zinc transport system substrate-binding protein
MSILRNALLSTFLFAAACGDKQGDTVVDATEDVGNVVVVASNYPVYYFADRIAEGVGDKLTIILPDISGDPAFWIPDESQAQLLQSADMILLNGAGAEPWLELISLDRRYVLNTTGELSDELIALEESVQHQHGPEGEHSHQGYAFTTWLNPLLAIEQARTVTQAFAERIPEAESLFEENMAKLEEDLVALDKRLAIALAAFNGQPVLFSHPVYQYLQNRYSINGASVHWEPDQEPTTPAWIALQQLRGTHPATIMLWEDEPLPSTAKRLSAAGISSVSFDTVANKPEEGDFLSAMNANITRIDEYQEHTRQTSD